MMFVEIQYIWRECSVLFPFFSAIIIYFFPRRFRCGFLLLCHHLVKRRREATFQRGRIKPKACLLNEFWAKNRPKKGGGAYRTFKFGLKFFFLLENVDKLILQTYFFLLSDRIKIAGFMAILVKKWDIVVFSGHFDSKVKWHFQIEIQNFGPRIVSKLNFESGDQKSDRQIKNPRRRYILKGENVPFGAKHGRGHRFTILQHSGKLVVFIFQCRATSYIS